MSARASDCHRLLSDVMNECVFSAEPAVAFNDARNSETAHTHGSAAGTEAGWAKSAFATAVA